VGYRKKEKSFFSKHCKHQPSITSLKEKWALSPVANLAKFTGPDDAKTMAKHGKKTVCYRGLYSTILHP